MINAPGNENTIKVVPAKPENWPDVEEYFSRMPCWCQSWRMSSSEFGRHTSVEFSEKDVNARRKESLRRQIESSSPPGVLAYLDGQMVGWCGIGPRHELERLVRSRTIPAIDDLPVWSIVCFLVRPGFRRRGVARALLRGAIECARSYGVPALEAYPIDPAGKRVDVNFAYVGLLPLFESEGFHRVVETSARSAGLPRWLVRLELT